MRRPRIRGLALIAILAGCSDSTVLPRVDTPDSVFVKPVTVSPATANLNVGDAITFVMSAGQGSGAVKWSSSDTTVATIDATGMARARAVGQATITGTLANDPTVKGAAILTVVVPVSIPSINVTITAINYSPSGLPANLDSLAGDIDVKLNVAFGSTQVSGADIIVNTGTADSLAASVEAQTPAAQPWTASLRWNTAARNDAGARRYPNGTYLVRARVRLANSTNTASSFAVSVTVRNP